MVTVGVFFKTRNSLVAMPDLLGEPAEPLTVENSRTAQWGLLERLDRDLGLDYQLVAPWDLAVQEGFGGLAQKRGVVLWIRPPRARRRAATRGRARAQAGTTHRSPPRAAPLLRTFARAPAAARATRRPAAVLVSVTLIPEAAGEAEKLQTLWLALTDRLFSPLDLDDLCRFRERGIPYPVLAAAIRQTHRERAYHTRPGEPPLRALRQCRPAIERQFQSWLRLTLGQGTP
jgi:hypothetical protein